MIDDVLGELKKVVKEGGVVAWNISSRPGFNTAIYHSMILEKHFSFLDTIIWEKVTAASPRFGNFVQYKTYYPNNTHEFVYVYSNGKFNRKSDADLEYALKFRNDVWKLRPENRDLGHPVPFPESLVETIIRLYSSKGDTVSDPFCGSGTTMKVARDLERNSVCVEIDPGYCNVAKNRVGFSQQSLFDDIEYKFVVV
jgi:DNA modification methylase